MIRKLFFAAILLTLTTLLVSFSNTSSSFKIGILKYNGGGDWYANI